MGGSRGGGGQGAGPPPLKSHKNLGFRSNTCLDPLKNNKATKPEFNVAPSSTRQLNAIQMALRWRADGGPLLLVFESSLPSSTKTTTKNNVVKVGPPLTKLSGSAHGTYGLPSGTTPIPCGGVWSTVACGTINEEESECDIGTVLTVLSVTVAQLASNASCQYHEIQPDEDTPSERYGKEGAGIWVTGTCIGIFNVCLGK